MDRSNCTILRLSSHIYVPTIVLRLFFKLERVSIDVSAYGVVNDFKSLYKKGKSIKIQAYLLQKSNLRKVNVMEIDGCHVCFHIKTRKIGRFLLLLRKVYAVI